MVQTRAMAAKKPIKVKTSIEMTQELKDFIASKASPKEIDELTADFMPKSRQAGAQIFFKHQGTVQFKTQLKYNEATGIYDFTDPCLGESSADSDTDRYVHILYAYFGAKLLAPTNTLLFWFSILATYILPPSIVFLCYLDIHNSYLFLSSEPETSSTMVPEMKTFNPDKVNFWGFHPRKPLIYNGMMLRHWVDESEWEELFRTVDDFKLLLTKLDEYDGLGEMFFDASKSTKLLAGKGKFPINLKGVTFNAWTKHETMADNFFGCLGEEGVQMFLNYWNNTEEREQDEAEEAEREAAKELLEDEALEAKAEKYAYDPDMKFQAPEAGNLKRKQKGDLVNSEPGKGRDQKYMRKAVPWIVWYEFRDFMLAAHEKTYNYPDPRISRREVKRTDYDEFLAWYLKSWGIDKTGELGLSQQFAIRQDGSILQINSETPIGYMERLEPVEEE
ncbi:MAG: hypothetical protein Q9183_004784 [Haloplaca sp. 2 TL-2023]